MSKQKRVNYEIANFPFDDLGIQSRTGMKLSSFGTLHQTTHIRNANGQPEEYSISLPAGMKSEAISYYIDAAQRNLMNPSLYLHPIVFPLWATLDSEGNHTRDEDGIAVVAFFEKWLLAFYREWLKLSEEDRQWIAGERQGLASAADLLEQVVQHPKNPKTHIHPNKRDTSKSPTISASIWSQDVTKRKQTDDKKKKFANLKKTDGKATEEKSTDLIIPDTNEIIYCDIRLYTKENIKLVGREKASERIHEYEKMKHVTYNKDGHPNASETNCELMNDLTILGPSMLWTPEKNLRGVTKLVICKDIITHYKPRSYGAGMSSDQLDTLEQKAAQKRALLGIVDSDSEDDATTGDAETKPVVFASKFEETNWEEQRECRKQLKVLGDRRTLLKKQVAEPSINDQKRKALKKELAIIDGRYKKKLNEQMELEEELEEMRNPVNSQDASMECEEDGDEEAGEREDDSGC